MLVAAVGSSQVETVPHDRRGMGSWNSEVPHSIPPPPKKTSRQALIQPYLSLSWDGGSVACDQKRHGKLGLRQPFEPA